MRFRRLLEGFRGVLRGVERVLEGFRGVQRSLEGVNGV